MIRNRFWVWLDTVGLMIVLSLTGCGSNPTAGTTTSVPPATTAQPNPNMAAAPPGMAPGANGNMAANMGMASPPGQMTLQNGNGGTATDPSAMMKAHMAANMAKPPGSDSAAPGTTPDPSAMMKAHMAGMAKPPGGGSAAPGANADPSAMMKAHMSAHGKAPGAAPGGAAMAPGGGPGLMANGGAAAPGAAGTQGTANNPNAAGMRAAGGPGGTGAQGTNFAAGSIEDTIFRFCTAMADGDIAAAAEFLSPKSKGLVGQIREGELSEEKIEEITNAISPVTELQPNPNQTSTKRSLRNKKNQVISFTLKKDKDDDTFKITEFSVSKPKKN